MCVCARVRVCGSWVYASFIKRSDKFLPNYNDDSFLSSSSSMLAVNYNAER